MRLFDWCVLVAAAVTFIVFIIVAYRKEYEDENE